MAHTRLLIGQVPGHEWVICKADHDAHSEELGIQRLTLRMCGWRQSATQDPGHVYSFAPVAAPAPAIPRRSCYGGWRKDDFAPCLEEPRCSASARLGSIEIAFCSDRRCGIIESCRITLRSTVPWRRSRNSSETLAAWTLPGPRTARWRLA